MKTNQHLLEKIQDALAVEKKLTGCLANTYILANDGAVIIAGSVASSETKTLAHQIVLATPGVNLLIDDLKVESSHSDRMGVRIDWANGRMALNRAS